MRWVSDRKPPAPTDLAQAPDDIRKAWKQFSHLNSRYPRIDYRQVCIYCCPGQEIIVELAQFCDDPAPLVLHLSPRFARLDKPEAREIPPEFPIDWEAIFIAVPGGRVKLNSREKEIVTWILKDRRRRS